MDVDIACEAVNVERRAAMRPKLAIVIPCYNYEQYVSRAVQSVLAQRREDCEIVVIDDGSLDGSWDVIRALNVPAYRKQNRVALHTCLFGVDRTTAPFVMFLDADDELRPGALDSILAKLDDNVAKLQFQLLRINESGEAIGGPTPKIRAFRDSSRLKRIVIGNGVYLSPPTSGNVFRRDLCEVARDSQSYERWIDGVMLFAAPFFGDVVSVDEPLGLYRIHGANQSGLGGAPTAATFKKDMELFLNRMAHLKKIVESKTGSTLGDPTKFPSFRELMFCLAITSGTKPRLAALPGLVLRLAPSKPLKQQLALIVYFLLGTVVSNARARSILAYRFSVGTRSKGGFWAALLKPAPRA